ncbi:hypothetical protein D3218_05485 [Aureimonas flava]|uniref:Uncharacterized protein n=1 Tax=Aureimonas flava TaxID=2320271 RepID=A0A3A1WP09_9HYPH|nr:hypothetical protein [Aureimonas flava]RIY02799.1 hypothetical protein D3218_05485 [Aureimonas flava]
MRPDIPPRHRLCIGLALVLALSGCAGMNRAVAVLPNTLDSLGGRPAPQGAATSAPAPAAAGPTQPGDAALAARP